MSNEMGQLASGVGNHMKYGTETIFFLPKHQVPVGIKETYANVVCDYILLKDYPYRVRFTVGGDRFIYPGDTSAPAASLLDSKLIFDSTISTPVDRFFCMDIKSYFLHNPMSRFEYMKILMRWFPKATIDQYNIVDLVEKDGFVYVDITRACTVSNKHLDFLLNVR